MFVDVYETGRSQSFVRSFLEAIRRYSIRCMNESPNYAQILRTIGQMLEALEIQSFELRIEAGDFMVSSDEPRQRRKSPRASSLRVFWQRLCGKKTGSKFSNKPSSGVLELHYTAADITRADSEGRSKREAAVRAPEPHSLSQILRAVGGFVDQQGGQLLTVRKQNQTVDFEYKSRLKTNVCKQYTVAGLYDYWVKMYLKRGDRAGSKR